MKKLFNAVSILAIFIMLGIFAAPEAVNAQILYDSKTADLTHFSASASTNTLIDSVTVVYYEWFTLRGYQKDFSYVTQTDTSTGLTSTWNQPPLRVVYKHTSTTGKPHLKYELEGTNNTADTSQHFTIGTVSAANDSVETWQKNDAFSFGTTKFLWYRIKVTGLEGNRSDVYAKHEIFYALPKNN